jgi:glycosyltransferase involved in cell wall biosynthesis
MERRTRGVTAILHDAQLLDLLTFPIVSWEEAATAVQTATGRPVSAADVESWTSRRDLLPFPAVPQVLARVDSVVVHSPLQAAGLSAHLNREVRLLPVAARGRFQFRDERAQSAARERCGYESQHTVVSAGYINAVKQPQTLIGAIGNLARWGREVDLVFVGTAEPAYQDLLQDQARLLGVAERVRFSGPVSERAYGSHLTGSDLAVHLRRPMHGQLSGGALDAAEAAVPGLASACLVEALDLPNDIIRPIPDYASSLMIAEQLEQALSERQEISRDSWTAFCHERSFAAYAKALAALLIVDAW